MNVAILSDRLLILPSFILVEMMRLSSFQSQLECHCFYHPLEDTIPYPIAFSSYNQLKIILLIIFPHVLVTGLHKFGNLVCLAHCCIQEARTTPGTRSGTQ